MSDQHIWSVAVPAPLRRLYSYNIPPTFGQPQPGARVLVPFGARRVTGFLVAPNPEGAQANYKIKNALKLIDSSPAIPKSLLDFLEEAAAYYMHPVGEVFKTALPAGMHVVERQGSLIQPRVKTRLHKLVRATPDAATGLEIMLSRAPKRAVVLQAVIDHAEIPLGELRKEFKNATDAVKRLSEAGLVVISEVEAPIDPYFSGLVSRDVPPIPTQEQAGAIEQISKRIRKGGYEGFVLQGVTGSGKTEVYMRVMKESLELGKGALVLVPEISLTPQLIGRFRARFGDGLAVWHSALTDRERFDQWKLLRSGKIKMAIGVRSAVFAPVADLGLIIVDEEHDGSFKQERGFAYNARDLALLRAARCGAVAVLGSATPSLESYHNTEIDKLTRIQLWSRATNVPLPKVEVVDLKRHRSGPNGQNIISGPLHAAIVETLDRGEQTILFLNRRGFSPSIQCDGCGEIIKCDDCSVSLTMHRRPARLICHYCGAGRPIPTQCPDCGSEELKPLGTGTQKVEDALAELFPNAKVARLDRDVGGGRKAEQILGKLRNGETDILIGTQMVTKGHDFPRVTLVGVINADVGLHMPDFRASERGFQLLTQVAGRAGRSSLGGKAMIQTRSPEHPAVVFATEHDFERFAALEKSIRHELTYPPYGRLAALRVSGLDPYKVENAARELAAHLRDAWFKLKNPTVTLLGPAPSPISKLQNRYRWQILLRSHRGDLIRTLLEPVIPFIEKPPGNVSIRIDIDPMSML